MMPKKVVFSFLPLALSVTVCSVSMTEGFRLNKDKYMDERKLILSEEQRNFTGGAIVLSNIEEKVNKILLNLKKTELQNASNDSTKFLPSNNFLLSRKDIEKSKVFQFIQKIPKGASLHTHLLAAVSANYIIEDLSYRDNVYGCYNNGIFKLKVLENPKQDSNCSWKSLKQYRKEQGTEIFNKFLKDKLVLNATTLSLNREQIWSIFKNTFSTIYDFVSYKPIFRNFITRLLEELWIDGIIYTELRGTFMPLYDLNGTVYDTKDFLETFIDVVKQFKATHDGFVGVKYIFCVWRGVDNSTLKTAMEELILYSNVYPDFLIGFDFVGNEDEGKDLVDFHEELLAFGKDIKYFFHAGETVRFGSTDLNLADAILLNSSRIGHGFALSKHPVLLEMAKQRDIPIELCPIANQVLKLHDDPRTHPAITLLSKGYPLVIGNDDPSTWEASGLSYDWYYVFMAMTWEDAGLGFFKKMALDSIKYSALNMTEKEDAFKSWEKSWTSFLNNIVNCNDFI